MARNPTLKAVSFDDLSVKYGAINFQDCLADYIAQVNNPGASVTVLHARAADTLLPFRSVPVFHRIKFSTSNTNKSEICDSVVVWPEQLDCYVLVERSARLELDGYDFVVWHVVLEASASDTR